MRFRWLAVFCVVAGGTQGQDPPQAGNPEVARIMREFPGRGDLGDGSEPLSPNESLQSLVVPDDLQIELVISEPQIAQPLHLSFDRQGRMWIVEYRQYPFPAGLKVVRYDQHLRAVFDRVPVAPPNHVRGADRISVLTDSDGDGIYDQQHVAIDGLNIATSVAVGRGGIWVLNPPYLLFYPDANEDAVIDADPIVHLSGFGLEDTHSVANSLLFSPDGWLYGVNGSTTTARVKVHLGSQDPVAYEGQCVWRYQPEQHRFEIFAEGGGNPFGLEIDSEGQIFSGTNWGDTRGMHYPQGGYGVKNWGKHGPLTNPYAFGYFNHMPFKGDGRRFTEELTVYEDNVLPERYRGQFIAVNPLQHVVYASHKLRDSSTYRTEDFETLISTSDQWFRPVDVTLGPDGYVYFADWYDTRLTHVDPRDNWHKTSGRVFRIRPKTEEAKPDAFQDLLPNRNGYQLGQLNSAQLIRLLDHPNRLLRFLAIEQLAEHPSPELIERIRPLVIQASSRQLEALWIYARLVGVETLAGDRELLDATTRAEDPHVRRWIVRLLGDHQIINDEVVQRLGYLAQQENDSQVRSQLASTAKRLPDEAGMRLALQMIAANHQADVTDHHIAMLLWWAIEGHCEDAGEVLVNELSPTASLWQSTLLKQTVLQRLAQRCALVASEESFALCDAMLRAAPNEECRELLLRGFEQGLSAGGFEKTLPPALAETLQRYRANSPIAAVMLRLRQGEDGAGNEALTLVRDTNQLSSDRVTLIDFIAQTKLAGAPAALSVCLNDSSLAVKRAALAALARFDDSSIGNSLAAAYQSLDSSTGLRPDVVRIMASRPSWAVKLIAEIDALKIPAEEVSADMVVQMQAHDDQQLRPHLQRLWGKVRSTPEEKRAQIERLNQLAKEKGDLTAGRKIYADTCAKCHRLFGEGGEVGPDLTGYERTNLDFLSLAMIDPSAAIREEYTNYQLLTVDGQLLTGILIDRNAQGVTLRTAEGQILKFPTGDIESVQASAVSLMPEDQLQGMTEQQIRDLMTYLTSESGQQ